MFTRHSLAVVAALLVAGCTGDEENPVSDPTEPVIEFDIPPPDVVTDWPCPPFEGVATTQDKVDDDDGDTLTDCQEEQIGSDPGNADTDGDGVGDFFEVGDLLRPTDTDGDKTPNILDTDDDGDLVPTLEEDLDADGDPRNDDVDQDGIANFLDADDDNDRVTGEFEDAPPAGNGNGDPRDDDYDNDGISNWLDQDDDADGAAGCEDPNANGDAFEDDSDGDSLPDFLDTDDDGDGIPTLEEDWDGSGTPCDDDLDGDTYKDFQDLDDENDSVPTLVEDLNNDGDPRNDDTDGDGIPNFRDQDDDGDGVLTYLEDLDANATGTGDTGIGIVLDDDTDDDGTPNYLDDDDDGDGCDTAIEVDDMGSHNIDTDMDGIPDYLDADTALCGPDTGTPPTPTGDTGTPPTPTGDTGTTTPTGPWSLTVAGTGYAGLNGNQVHAVVVRDSDSTQVGTGNDTLATAMFNVVVPGVLDVGETYTVDYFIDLDASGTCDPKTETSWRLTGISTIGMDEVVAAPQGSNQDPAACATFP